MLANLDREQFLELLRKLGDDDDETVLTAARDLDARITVAGIDWDDLLVPEESDEEAENEEDEESTEDEFDTEDEGAGDDDEEDEDGDDDSDEDEDERALNDQEKTEALALIDKILERGVSKDTQEELNEYKQDIAEDDFYPMDLRYLRALNQRLSK